MSHRIYQLAVWPSCILITAAWVSPALAYRPFESTDADVVSRGELEIEWGALTIERQAEESTYIMPDLVFNLGLSQRTEIIGEFVVERIPGGSWDTVDAGAFVKTVWRDGLLQGEPGISFATETGLLLPGTTGEEDGVGAEGIAIVSLQLAAITLHLNAGGGVTRVDGEPFALGGVIAEYPLSSNFRLAAELDGEKVSGEDIETSLLLGGLWEPEGMDGKLDFGVRRGLSDQATDWAITVGASFSFKLF